MCNEIYMGYNRCDNINVYILLRNIPNNLGKFMNEEKRTKSINLINELVNKEDSMRAFARLIDEQCSDVSRWCAGKAKIKVRAIIEICRLYPKIIPADLNHEVFPTDLRFIFKLSKK